MWQQIAGLMAHAAAVEWIYNCKNFRAIASNDLIKLCRAVVPFSIDIETEITSFYSNPRTETCLDNVLSIIPDFIATSTPMRNAVVVVEPSFCEALAAIKEARRE